MERSGHYSDNMDSLEDDPLLYYFSLEQILFDKYNKVKSLLKRNQIEVEKYIQVLYKSTVADFVENKKYGQSIGNLQQLNVDDRFPDCREYLIFMRINCRTSANTDKKKHFSKLNKKLNFSAQKVFNQIQNDLNQSSHHIRNPSLSQKVHQQQQEKVLKVVQNNKGTPINPHLFPLSTMK